MLSLKRERGSSSVRCNALQRIFVGCTVLSAYSEQILRPLAMLSGPGHSAPGRYPGALLVGRYSNRSAGCVHAGEAPPYQKCMLCDVAQLLDAY